VTTPAGGDDFTGLPEAERLLGTFADRLASDSGDAEKGLAQLVLSLVELLRQLMERQAVRRVEAGGLTDDQVERLGTTLLQLKRRMDELCEAFGIEPDDLALDLGPLGRSV
jgi:uncharacterized protein YceH (UPF0502 family)